MDRVLNDWTLAVQECLLVLIPKAIGIDEIAASYS